MIQNDTKTLLTEIKTLADEIMRLNREGVAKVHNEWCALETAQAVAKFTGKRPLGMKPLTDAELIRLKRDDVMSLLGEDARNYGHTIMHVQDVLNEAMELMKPGKTTNAGQLLRSLIGPIAPYYINDQRIISTQSDYLRRKLLPCVKHTHQRIVALSVEPDMAINAQSAQDALNAMVSLIGQLADKLDSFRVALGVNISVHPVHGRA